MKSKEIMKYSLTYSAPAKVILSGEHAVVYGKPALVSAIDLRLHFTVTEAENNITDKTVLFISELVRKFLKKKNISYDTRSFNFKIVSSIPQGTGLGSSAALSTASVAALLEFYTGRAFDLETINNLSYKVEKFFHQNPSGVDNTVSCFGGLVFFRREFEFLKTISLLNFKIPQKIERNLYLIYSGKPIESTAEMVKSVGAIYNSKPAVVEEIFCEIERSTKKMTVALASEERLLFKQALIKNQLLLEKISVVSKKTQNLLRQLQSFGVGKITGAGGKKRSSGFLFFYTDSAKNLEDYLNDKKLSFYKFRQTSIGVRKE